MAGIVDSDKRTVGVYFQQMKRCSRQKTACRNFLFFVCGKTCLVRKPFVVENILSDGFKLKNSQIRFVFSLLVLLVVTCPNVFVAFRLLGVKAVVFLDGNIAGKIFCIAFEQHVGSPAFVIMFGVAKRRNLLTYTEIKRQIFAVRSDADACVNPRNVV